MTNEPGVQMMLNLANEIEKCISAQLFHTALLTAMTIPDICGALESKDGQSSGNNYSHWFDTYVAPDYRKNQFTGKDCYRCRCSLLHQGKTSQFIFLSNKQKEIADYGVWPIHGGQSLIIEIPVFCRNIVHGIHAWLEIVEHSSLFINNSQKALLMLRLSFTE
jgi:hypothetical protein